jgi:hypothetical protein
LHCELVIWRFRDSSELMLAESIDGPVVFKVYSKVLMEKLIVQGTKTGRCPQILFGSFVSLIAAQASKYTLACMFSSGKSFKILTAS